MAGVVADARPTEAVVKEHMSFADAALALAGHEVTDPKLRAIVESAALHELTADEAVAAIRYHVQG